MQWEDESNPLPFEKLFNNTHLNSPLRFKKVNDALEGNNRQLQKELSTLKSNLAVSDSFEQKGFTGALGKLNSVRFLDDDYTDYSNDLNVFTDLSTELINEQIPGLQNRVASNVVMKTWIAPVLNKGIQKLFILRSIFMGGIFLTSGGKSSELINLEHKPCILWGWEQKDKCYFWRNNYIEIGVGQNLSIIKWRNGRWWIGTRDHLMMIKDILSQRFLLLLSSSVASNNSRFPKLSVDDLYMIFSWGDEILMNLGEKGYALLSSWEAICTGVLQNTYDDPLVDKTEFFREIKNQFLETYPTWLLKDQAWDKAERFLSRIARISPHLLSEAYGLYRIWGHPTVDGLTAIRKLKESALNNRPFNYTVINDVYVHFCELFCTNYKKLNGIWPNLDCSSLPSTSYLRECIESNVSLDTRSKRYNKREWKSIQAGKTFNIDLKFNIQDMISDSALSLTKSELFNQVKGKKNIGSSYERSVITQWLKSNLSDPLEFLSRIDLNGFGEENSLTGVCPKEREMKMYARLFGLLTFDKRTYVVLTESLIAEYILPLFPEITMMDDEIKLLKKMYSATNNIDGKEKSIIVSFDFMKWNSNMRFEETTQIFTFIDRLFGFNNCINRTHEMFNQGVIYLADGTYLPKYDNQGNFIEDEGCYRGHLGGIEGLRQKGWTIFTVTMINMIATKHSLKFQLMGQGDNQVIKLIFPATEDDQVIRAKHKEFLRDFTNLLSQVGPPLKLEETWSSSNLYIYGKNMIFKGVPLEMWMKRICRMFPLSNEGYPVLETSLSSLTANCSSAIFKSTDSLTIYFIYLVSVLETFYLNLIASPILGHPLEDRGNDCSFTIPKKGYDKFGKFHDKGKFHIREALDGDLNKKWKTDIRWCLKILAIFPKALGGYPVQFLAGFLSRGFPDPVTEGIAILKQISKVTDEMTRIVINNMLQQDFCPYINPEMIFNDPVSINWFHPSSPGEGIKRAVFEALPNLPFIRNLQFKTMLRHANTRQEELAKTLFTMYPFFPRIGYEVLNSTLQGIAQKCVNQITKTNSMILLCRDSLSTLSLKVKRMEIDYYQSVKYRLLRKRSQIDYLLDDCSSKLASKLRKEGWGKDAVVGVTVACNWEAFQGYICGPDLCSDHQTSWTKLGYLLVSLDKLASFQYCHGWLRLGPHIPYMGSKTRERTTGYGKRIANLVPPLVSGALKLQNLIGWAVDTYSNLANLLRRLVTAVCNLDPDTLAPPPESISGSPIHQFADRITEHGGSLSIQYTLGSYVYFSTNTLTAYNKGSQNTNLHFQELMCATTSCLGIFLQELPYNVPLTTHLHVKCPECIQIITEEKMEIDNFIPERIIPSYPDVPWCYYDLQLDDFLLNEVQNKIKKCPPSQSDHEAKDRLGSVLSFEAWKLIYLVALESDICTLVGKTTFSSNYRKNTARVPIVWCYKMTLKDVLPPLALRILCSLIMQNLSKLKINTSSISDVLLFELSAIPRDAYLPLTPLLGCEDRLIDVLTTPFFSTLSSKCPPRSTDLAETLKQAIENLIQNWFFDPETFELGPLLIHQNHKYLDQHPHLLELTRLIVKSLNKSGEILKDLLLNMEMFKRAIDREKFREQGILCDGMIDILGLWQKNKSFSSGFWITMLNLFENNKYRITEESSDYIVKLLPILSYDYEEFPFKPIDTRTLPRTFKILSTSSHESLDNKPRSYKFIEKGIKSRRRDLTDPNIISKSVTYPTTAPYKILSLLTLISNWKIDKIASFADGSGGFLSTSLKVFSSARGFFNTLFNLSSAEAHTAMSFIPSSLLLNPSLMPRIDHLDFTRQYQSDITNEEYSKNFLRLGWYPDLITCDIEANDLSLKSVIRAWMNLLKIAERSKSKIFIGKLLVESNTYLFLFCSLTLQYFKKVLVVRTYFSSQYNREVYIIGLHHYEMKRTLSYSIEDKLVIVNTNFLNDQKGVKMFQLKPEYFSRTVKEMDALPFTSALSSPWTSSKLLNLYSLIPALIKLKIALGQDPKVIQFPVELWSLSNKLRNPGRFKLVRERRLRMGSDFSERVLRLFTISWIILESLAGESLNDYRSSQSYVYFYMTLTRSWGFLVSKLDLTPKMNSTIKIPLEQLIRPQDWIFITQLSHDLMKKLHINLSPGCSSNCYLSRYSEALMGSKKEGLTEKWIPADLGLLSLTQHNLDIYRSKKTLITKEGDFLLSHHMNDLEMMHMTSGKTRLSVNYKVKPQISGSQLIARPKTSDTSLLSVVTF